MDQVGVREGHFCKVVSGPCGMDVGVQAYLWTRCVCEECEDIPVGLLKFFSNKTRRIDPSMAASSIWEWSPITVQYIILGKVYHKQTSYLSAHHWHQRSEDLNSMVSLFFPIIK